MKQTLHKKTDMISALKMDKREFSKVCTGEKCKNCALRRDFNITSSCYPVLLKHDKAHKKRFIKELLKIDYPAPFRDVRSARALVQMVYEKSRV